MHAGLCMLVAGMRDLDKETATELVRFGIAEMKKVLPVRVEFDLFNADDQVVGRVPQWMSQKEAEERFGL